MRCRLLGLILATFLGLNLMAHGPNDRAYNVSWFELVLMDIQMPRMDGFEATAAIREREKVTGGHIPIVAMTAHALIGDQERCMASGMDGYVSKPIRTSELFATIERMLGDKVKPESAEVLESLGPLMK